MKNSPLFGARDTYSNKAVLDLSRQFGKIILWGLTSSTHTHFYVFLAYFRVCKLLGLNIEWVSESDENAELIQSNDMVFIHGSTNCLIRKVLERGPIIVDFHVDQNRERLGDLLDIVACYPRRITERERHEPNSEFLDPLTSFSPASNILTQPWGSDLVLSEFEPPAHVYWSDKLYWIGSWWKNEHWGNYDEIEELISACKAADLKFIQLTDCATSQNRLFVRQSRLGPAIAGAGQARQNYLACRFFKNISYGQFCVSNVRKSQEVLAGTAIYSDSVLEAIGMALDVNQKKADELVRFQQQCIRNYTVAAHLYIIMLAAKEYALT